MRALLLVASAAIAATAACSRSPQPAAGGPGHWEASVIEASQNASDVALKVNVATGATWLYCCGVSNLVPISDGAPVPAGDYHLMTWKTTGSDGALQWNVWRLDAATGRLWVCSPQSPWRWIEVTPNGKASTH